MLRSSALHLISAGLIAVATSVGAGEPAPGLAELVPTLLPAVVNIYTIRIEAPPSGQSGRTEAAEPRTKKLLGSGFIIDPAGVIVTNNHVIANAYNISVTLQDNTTLKAELLAASSLGDIALLTVHAGKPLPVVKFGDSSRAHIGDPVFAIGNPLGLGGSVSAGIVSQLNRDIMLTPYDDFIQTDAAINHGNSGGPLFNLRGEVIGINTALYAPPGETGSVGLGFAIPSNDANFVVTELRKNGRVRVGFIGAHLQQVTQDIATAVGLPRIEGAIINDSVPGGPAARAGLAQGDVIIKDGDRELPDSRAVARAIAESPIGHVAKLTIWRNQRAVTVSVSIGEWPGDERQASKPAMPPRTEPLDLGLKLAAITDALREEYKLALGEKGVLVTGVTRRTAAEDRGLHVGDVIVTAQMAPVATPTELLQRLDELRRQGRRYVLLLVRDRGGDRSVAVPLGLLKAG